MRKEIERIIRHFLYGESAYPEISASITNKILALFEKKIDECKDEATEYFNKLDHQCEYTLTTIINIIKSKVKE
jgi:hypothetical protein